MLENKPFFNLSGVDQPRSCSKKFAHLQAHTGPDPRVIRAVVSITRAPPYFRRNELSANLRTQMVATSLLSANLHHHHVNAMLSTNGHINRSTSRRHPQVCTRPTFSRGNVRGRRRARGTRVFALTRATPKRTVHDHLPSLWTGRCRRFKIPQNWFRTELRFRNISISRC